ncbi:MAG: DUF2314 domain-containing protein [Woeseiaceae bacterium]|nr:DUF2314 domain-containing protein [Woeseiaceae bacterium]
MIREILGRLWGLLALAVGLALGFWALRAAFGMGEWSKLFALIPAAVFALYGLGRMFPGQPPPLPIETDDPLMKEAFDRAKREWRRFERGLAEGKREALIKHPMKTGYGDNEHVWAVAHSIDDGHVVATLASQPVGDEAEIKNERQRIRIEDVEDWLLIEDGGRMEGGFTQIAMAKIYKRDKGYVPYAIRKTLPDMADLNDPTLQA